MPTIQRLGNQAKRFLKSISKAGQINGINFIDVYIDFYFRNKVPLIGSIFTVKTQYAVVNVKTNIFAGFVLVNVTTLQDLVKIIKHIFQLICIFERNDIFFNIK